MSGFILQVSAGVGPPEVRRFVFQLAARLEQVAAARGLALTDVVATGAPDAPRSIALYLDGDAPAQLADELGSHVLLARSARRGRAARKRWFAAVTLHAHTPPPAATAAPPPRADVVITACRAGGPGGQHVNKVASAVRVLHVPSGLSVRASGERSQHANLRHALRRLAELLHAQAAARAAGDDQARWRAHHRLERGRAVRAYVVGADGGLEERAP